MKPIRVANAMPPVLTPSKRTSRSKRRSGNFIHPQEAQNEMAEKTDKNKNKEIENAINHLHEVFHPDEEEKADTALIVLTKTNMTIGATVCGSPVNVGLALTRIPKPILQLALSLIDVVEMSNNLADDINDEETYHDDVMVA